MKPLAHDESLSDDPRAGEVADTDASPDEDLQASAATGDSAASRDSAASPRASLMSPQHRGKPRFYQKHSGELRQRLAGAIPQEQLRQLHKVEPWRHFALAARHGVLYLGCAVALFYFDNPWIWIPLVVFQGFNILGFIILLHDHVHKLIFRRRRPRAMRLLGLLYALPSAISATQFDLWHNDHHRELGSSESDPKRAHLSPKRNARWYKFLYFTPALFLIYARAASREARGYPAELKRRILWERLANVAIHLSLCVLLASFGWEVLLRVHLIPLFLCFPPAFFLNRLGQHYDIDPDDVAAWSTLVNGNLVWRFLFLNSNHHIEHHYYPSVPLYNLPQLNRCLQPFFKENNIRNRGYTYLLTGWLWRNKAPHSNWELDLV